MPYMTAHLENTSKFRCSSASSVVPFWALAYAFWTQPNVLVSHAGAGWAASASWEPPSAKVNCPRICWPTRTSSNPRRPENLHIATTVANGCCLGAEPAETAGTDDLKVAYEVFKDGARDIDSDYQPKTVNTDGWAATRAAWKQQLSEDRHHLVLLAWLAQGPQERAKHLKAVFVKVSRRVWEAYHAPDRRSFGQRLRSRSASGRAKPDGSRPGKCPEPVATAKRDRWSIAYRYPHGHRTSNMLDRQMRGEPLLRPRPTSARRV